MQTSSSSITDAIDSEIAALSVTLTATNHRLICKIREFDERDGYVGQGFLSCAHYLNYRIGLSLNAGREKVRVGHALKVLPLIDAAFAAGTLSYSKVRALTRIATPITEEDLLCVANDVSAQALEKLVRSVRRVETQASAVTREEARELTCFTDADGMTVIRGRLLAEEGALLVKALESMPLPKVAAAPGKRFADAIVRLAETALGSGGDSSAADRFQVVVHVDEAVLANPDSTQLTDGRAEVEGCGVSAEVCRRIACDCSIVTMTHDKNGKVVDVSRKTRVISTPLRRKLKERDRQCQFPGCTSIFVDGHHVRHWKDGGATTLDNVTSICRTHHRYVHEYGYAVERDADGRMVFRDPNGKALSNKPASLEPVMRVTWNPTEQMPAPRWNSHDIRYGEVVSACAGGIHTRSANHPSTCAPALALHNATSKPESRVLSSDLVGRGSLAHSQHHQPASPASITSQLRRKIRRNAGLLFKHDT